VGTILVQPFTVDADRAGEYIELYESLGEEVRVEPVMPGSTSSEECSTCLLGACH
jgi:hypothetical protein